MSVSTSDTAIAREPSFPLRMARMLLADKFALCAAIFLLLVVVLALIGPSWLGDLATKQNLRGRNLAPFDWSREWVWWMGADALGRTGAGNGCGGWELMLLAVPCSPALSSPPRTP